MFSQSSVSEGDSEFVGATTSVGTGSRGLDAVAADDDDDDAAVTFGASSPCGNSNFVTRSKTLIHLNEKHTFNLQLDCKQN